MKWKFKNVNSQKLRIYIYKKKKLLRFDWMYEKRFARIRINDSQ